MELLPDGSPEPIERSAARRDRIIQTFGNLTLLVQPLNSAVSNGPFEAKRQGILDNSVLRLNSYLREKEDWNEDIILERGRSLFQVAKQVWPYPARSQNVLD
jgi:hypothetical protein